jgi:RimJ/RimL family protein N-acetyltransferase
MIGDINFFVHPYVDEDVDDSGAGATTGPQACIGEIDIMIAHSSHRGKGLGKSAAVTFIHYVLRNMEDILREYGQTESGAAAPLPDLKKLMVKIKKDNTGSIALFRGLGFEQVGDVNYFGEVKLLADTARLIDHVPEGYAELVYSRPSE